MITMKIIIVLIVLLLTGCVVEKENPEFNPNIIVKDNTLERLKKLGLYAEAHGEWEVAIIIYSTVGSYYDGSINEIVAFCSHHSRKQAEINENRMEFIPDSTIPHTKYITELTIEKNE